MHSRKPCSSNASTTCHSRHVCACCQPPGPRHSGQTACYVKSTPPQPPPVKLLSCCGHLKVLQHGLCSRLIHWLLSWNWKHQMANNKVLEGPNSHSSSPALLKHQRMGGPLP